MAKDFRITFDTKDLIRMSEDLRSGGSRVDFYAKRALEKTAFDIQAMAQFAVPVQTGFLKNSIGVSFSEGGLAAEIGPTADYGVFIEFGTSVMSPQPYLIPAFDRNVPLFARALGQIPNILLKGG